MLKKFRRMVMKNYFIGFFTIVLCLFFIFNSTKVDAREDHLNVDDVNIICSFKSYKFNGVIKLVEPKPEALRAVELLTDIAGIENDIEVFGAEIDPSATFIAFATLREGKKIIVYDAAKMFVYGQNTITFQSLSIMAHEVGHHLGSHTIRKMRPRHEQELEADKVSGAQLRILNATKKQALSYHSLVSVEATENHPGKEKRMNAILEGWKNADLVMRNNH